MTEKKGAKDDLCSSPGKMGQAQGGLQIEKVSVMGEPPSYPPASSSFSPENPHTPPSGVPAHPPKTEALDKLSHQLFRSIEHSDFGKANEILGNIQHICNESESNSKQVFELLGATRKQLENTNPSTPKGKTQPLIQAVDKVHAALQLPGKLPPQKTVITAVSLIKNTSNAKGDNPSLISRIASTFLPISLNYVLDNIWSSYLYGFRRLVLSGLSFSPISFQSLLRVLPTITSLSHFSCTSCFMIEEDESRKWGDEEIHNLCESTKELPQLQSLGFSHHKIQKRGIQSIADSLARWKNLNLSFCQLEGTNIPSICDALKHPQCQIESLNLSLNLLRKDALPLITEALRHNTSLLYLDLSGNRFTCEDAKELIDCLEKDNHALATLALFDCLEHSAVPIPKCAHGHKRILLTKPLE